MKLTIIDRGSYKTPLRVGESCIPLLLEFNRVSVAHCHPVLLQVESSLDAPLYFSGRAPGGYGSFAGGVLLVTIPPQRSVAPDTAEPSFGGPAGFDDAGFEGPARFGGAGLDGFAVRSLGCSGWRGPPLLP